MTDYGQVNFFTDRAVQDDPYPYFEWVRDQGPVWQEPRYGVFMITGHAEAKEVYRDPATFPEMNALVATNLTFDQNVINAVNPTVTINTEEYERIAVQGQADQAMRQARAASDRAWAATH